MLKGNGQAGAKVDLTSIVAQILREEIALAMPDDLEWLEFQVPRIASNIVDRLNLKCDRQ
jgi:hypothetical protein